MPSCKKLRMDVHELCSIDVRVLPNITLTINSLAEVHMIITLQFVLQGMPFYYTCNLVFSAFVQIDNSEEDGVKILTQK